MEVEQSASASLQSGFFHHKPLDYGKVSIRCIRILPQLTSGGKIRCEVFHTTIKAQIVYRCLSYQWGEPHAATSREIEVNGQPFVIRKNLYDFLHILQSSIGHNTILDAWAGEAWWMDAICIDQHNVLERNHQVAHMGSIYSEAEEVVIWLGLASLAKNRVGNLLDLTPSSSESADKERNERGGATLHKRRLIGRRIIRNEYWHRAWITQEIALAQSVSVLIDRLLYGFDELVDRLSLMEIPWEHSHLVQFIGIRSGTIDLSTRSLIELLNHFRDRKCTIPEDRVFSLLSLCSNPGETIRVDYNMSKDLLAHQIMGSVSNTNSLPA